MSVYMYIRYRHQWILCSQSRYEFIFIVLLTYTVSYYMMYLHALLWVSCSLINLWYYVVNLWSAHNVTSNSWSYCRQFTFSVVSNYCFKQTLERNYGDGLFLRFFKSSKLLHTCTLIAECRILTPEMRAVSGKCWSVNNLNLTHREDLLCAIMDS